MEIIWIGGVALNRLKLLISTFHDWLQLRKLLLVEYFYVYGISTEVQPTSTSSPSRIHTRSELLNQLGKISELFDMGNIDKKQYDKLQTDNYYERHGYVLGYW